MSTIRNPANWIWAIRENRKTARASAQRWLASGAPIDRHVLEAALATQWKLENELLEWCES